MRFEVGDMVRISKDCHYYDLLHSPQMNGVVKSYSLQGGVSLKVNWENGNTYSYQEKDLRLVKKGE